MSTNYDQMEEIWGLGAIYSEYQIDDGGLPFYVWHLGESTIERHYGVCVGFIGSFRAH